MGDRPRLVVEGLDRVLVPGIPHDAAGSNLARTNPIDPHRRLWWPASRPQAGTALHHPRSELPAHERGPQEPRRALRKGKLTSYRQHDTISKQQPPTISIQLP